MEMRFVYHVAWYKNLMRGLGLGTRSTPHTQILVVDTLSHSHINTYPPLKDRKENESMFLHRVSSILGTLHNVTLECVRR